MKDVRFYLEYPSSADKRKGNHSGTVFAAFSGNGTHFSSGQWCQEGVGGVFDRPDSPVAGTSVSLQYLRKQCKRISEKQAREIHPNLFAYLDAA